MEPVIIFLCTPRCGTQWLVKNLIEAYSNQIVVLHEPIKYEYYLRNNLRRYHEPSQQKNNIELSEHLEFVGEVTESKKYIEIGWQSIAGISDFYRRFGNRLKLIHLYRNPVHVAASLVTHNWYIGKNTERSKKAELNPYDAGSILEEYRDRWDNLNLFEKSLFYWTEINLCAKDLKYKYNDVPFYSLKFENLFKINREISRIYLTELLSFIGLQYEVRMLDAIDIPYDEYQYRNTTQVSLDWKIINSHPQTIALANKLGYKFDNKIELKRYKGLGFVKKIIKRIKSVYM